MSLSGYDLRKRGGPRRRRPPIRLRPMTPGEICLAGWIVYAIVLWVVLFAIDQRGIVRVWSGWMDERPPAHTER